MLLDAGIGAADLDDCCRRDAKNKRIKIDQWARDLRATADGAYCEVTVSGTGLRLIGIAEGPEVHRKFKIETRAPTPRLSFSAILHASSP